MEAAELLRASSSQNTSVIDDSESSSDDEELREQRLERFRIAVEKESLQAAEKVARSEDRRKKRDQKKLEVAQQTKVLQEQQTSMSRPPPGSGVQELKARFLWIRLLSMRLRIKEKLQPRRPSNS